MISLPIYPDLTSADVNAVVGTIRLAHEHAEETADELDHCALPQLQV